MKKLLLLSASIFAFLAHGATVNLEWDPNPPSDGPVGYQVFAVVGRSGQLIGTSATNGISIQLPDGAFKLVFVATNIALKASDPSDPFYVVVAGTNVVSITNKPGSPLNIQLR